MRENELLQHVYTNNAGLAGAFPAVTIPPGDDMGAVDFGGRTLLVAVDQVIDGVHFELASMPLEKIGRKAVTRNLSDVAAMAAKPVAAVVAAALPRGLGQDRAAALFDAMRQTGEAYGCPLVGGDTAIHDGPLTLGITVFAEPWTDGQGEPIAPVERRGAQPGDAIYVTGELGHSFATGHHLDFEPRLELARHLVTASGGATRPTAMIDVSDGIAQDLPRLVDHAELHARIFPLRDPTPALAPGSQADQPTPGREPWQHAVGDGEDYELLFTAPESAPIPDAFGDDEDEANNLLITRIGTVTDAGGIVVITPENQQVVLSDSGGGASRGWEHGA